MKNLIKSVIDHGNKEIELNTRFKAIARFDYTIDGVEKYVWVYSVAGPGRPNISVVRGRVIHDDRINTQPDYVENDRVGSKNSPIMQAILTREDRFTSFVFREKVLKLEVTTEFRRNPHSDRFDSKGGQVKNKLVDDDFGSIVDYWNGLQDLGDANKDETLAEVLRLRREAHMDSTVKRLRLIREGNELRMKHFLDPVQSRIKFRDLDSGPFILEGGPGSGKTTTLIQRFKYITDPHLERDPEYPATLKDRLQSGNAWLFFSPTETLLYYLKQAIAEEGLVPTSNSTTHLKSFIKTYSKETGLVQPGKESAYKTAPNRMDVDVSLRAIESWISGYEKHLVEHFKKQVRIALEKVPMYEQKYPAIRKLSPQFEKLLNQVELGQILQMLKIVSASDALSIKKEQDDLKQRLNLTSSRMLNQFRNENLLGELRALIEVAQPDSLGDLEDDFEEDSESELELDEELRIQSKISSWIRLVSLRHVEKQALPSGGNRVWLDRVKIALEDTIKKEIGLIAGFVNRYEYFKKNLDQHLKQIYSQYKVFRTHRGAELLPSPSWNLFWSSAPKNPTTIHETEMLLLLLFGNGVSRSLKKMVPRVYRESQNPMIAAYRNWERVMIGIDEASDFTTAEIRFMMSFADEQYNCVSLVGDIMQRLQSHGLQSWDDIHDLVSDKVALEVSYRQSSKLLALAAQLHEQATGRPLALRSHYKDSTHEPDPWLTKRQSLDELSFWIAEKIIVIYHDYDGKLPSIALFAPDDQTVRELAKSLNEVPFFEENNFSIRACTTDQPTINNDGITVYHISLIKGMEFDAAFFVDVDRIQADDQLLLKYLYVGISRAAFFFGMTYRDQIPVSLESVLTSELIRIES